MEEESIPCTLMLGYKFLMYEFGSDHLQVKPLYIHSSAISLDSFTTEVVVLLYELTSKMLGAEIKSEMGGGNAKPVCATQ